MKRLTPEWKQFIRDILAAYAETGWIPIQGKWVVLDEGSRKVGGCGFGVLAKVRGIEYSRVSWISRLSTELGISIADVEYFFRGFDFPLWAMPTVRRYYSRRSSAFRAGMVCARLAFRTPPRERDVSHELKQVSGDASCDQPSWAAEKCIDIG